VRLWPKSLRAQLSWAVLAPSLLFLAALIGLAWFAARATLEDAVGRRLRDTAAASAAQLPTGLVARFTPDKARTHANLLGRLKRVGEASGARRVFLAALDGRSLVDTASDAPPPGSPDRTLAQDRVELSRVAEGETAASVLYRALDGTRYKRGYAPVRHDGQVVAVLGVEGSAASYGALDDLRDYMLALGGFALVALGLVVFGFSRALTAPLQHLATAAARIGRGELDAPVALERERASELALLSSTMDEMRSALLRRDREMQMMLGGIAHEVRNPLGGMELFAGLLREDLAGQDAELELLARVEKELGVLKRVVEEFLAYARRTPIERSDIELSGLVAEIDSLVEAKVVTEPGGTVSADREQLRRLLLNLASNAAQAGATRVTIGVDPRGLRVIDDGPGIPTELAEKVFDAFYTTREKGTGLGLALCRRIAEAHGGRLELTNPGEPGASFLIVAR